MRFMPLVLALTCASPAFADVPCGGSFSSFVKNVKTEAIRLGHDKSTVNAFLANAAHSPAVIKADRSQGVFKKDFIEFSRAVISQNRISNGASNGAKYKSVFDKVEQQYGVSRGVLLAFWALETDYGQVQGNFNTLNSLLTLGHDCRRPDLFQPQIFAALELYEQGDFDPVNTKGAWAGEIGMVQMLPEDILRNGVDGDGDGHVSLKTSAPDALMSGGKMLNHLGWRKGEPWLQEVQVPDNLDWSKTGLDQKIPVSEWAKMGVKPRAGNLGNPNLKASILLPMGRKGPAFIAYPNFDIYFEWNKSFVYVTTAAYFATRLEGASSYKAGNPEQGLNDAQMKSLQTKLGKRGHDVGKVDGILGAKTRAAVQSEQERLGMPADAWPTAALLNKL
ncbi:lytic murein transglycosylase [Pacificibacter marinus]|uniref:Membrane-bound lytic murein transglycosylase B n=1 Tax=Pacificibacter marinus TaxID=658057 RepID=A0A1Y5S3T6_9RHOB|nr:lytic murein transglycosylase [Pacificibacter marinus]SEK90617.1 lytic murein transglycosylase [Pacificibacter marinus]SLN32033.1 Membrane-bound lytic murein transglycosylase B precursor [Pacificibacter marinus]